MVVRTALANPGVDRESWEVSAAGGALQLGAHPAIGVIVGLNSGNIKLCDTHFW